MSKKVSTRFIVSLIANVLRSGLSFLTALLLARWLGPVDYGRMMFLLVSFLALRQLLDMASSSAFFTFLSQRPRSRRFVSFYWRWLGIQFLATILVIWLLLPSEWVAGIWKGEGRTLVLLAFVAAFMQNVVWNNASQMAEAQRETVKVQRLNTLVVILHLGVVVGLWLIGKLAVPILFAAIALEWVLAGLYASRLYRGHAELEESGKETNDSASSVLGKYWHYCLPFIPYSVMAFAHDFGSRWMLQNWGGSTQQAYFAIAAQFAAMALIATTSILRIFWKEIAEAHHRKDYARMEQLYHRVSRGLYFFGAIIAGGLLPWAGEIIQLTLGAAYIGGTFTMMLMFLYPIHQSMGQIGSTMLYSTSHTRIQVVLGSVFMGLSLAVAYFMMAPKSAFVPGLGLASRGLAYQMVIMQIMQVNVMAWFIARIFKWKYDWGYQIVGLALAVAAGWLTKIVVTGLITAPLIVSMVIAAPLYLTVIAIMFYAVPWVGGLTRGELRITLQPVLRRIPAFRTGQG